ncbi:MAG: hypothetical protein ACFFC7_04340 [Candidatus Hermodarchaeota archaeon]
MANLKLRMCLLALKGEPTPFDRYVSKAHVPDMIDISRPRHAAEKAFLTSLRLVEEENFVFLPIIGEAGTGKTHFFWFIKEIERKYSNYWRCVYVPSPPSSERIALHIYSCCLDQLSDLLPTASNNLMLGFLNYKNREKITQQGFIDKIAENYGSASKDILNALFTYKEKRGKNKILAERFLLGDLLPNQSSLSIKSRSLEDKDIGVALKLLARYYRKTLVFYFDELEIPFRSNIEGIKEAFLSSLKNLSNIPNTVIITACLTDFWPNLKMDLKNLFPYMTKEADLLPFSVQDLKDFYWKAMNHWWQSVCGVFPPSDHPYFPLIESDFDEILLKTNGNPRNCIKLIRKYLDARFSVYLEGSADPPSLSHDDSLKLDILEEESLIISNETISQALITTLTGRFNSLKYQYELVEKPQFDPKERISFYLNIENTKIGIQIPKVKSFNRDGGIAAYYALQSLKNTIDAGHIHYGLMIAPFQTQGEKFIDLLAQAKFRVKCLYVNGEVAENLILHSQNSSFGREIVRNILTFLNQENSCQDKKISQKTSSFISIPIYGTPYQLQSESGLISICRANNIQAAASATLSTDSLVKELEIQFLESTGRDLTSFVSKKTLINLINKISK